MSAIDPLVYAYAIVRQHDGGSLMSLSPVEGVNGGQLRTVSCGELAAVISDVPQTEDGAIEDVWRDLRTESSTWCSIITVSFGQWPIVARYCLCALVQYFPMMTGWPSCWGRSDNGCAKRLNVIDGAREWGIQVFCDRAALRSRLGEEAPAIRAAREQIAATTAGRAFFLRHKLELALDAEIQNAIDRCVADCRTSLRSAARAATNLKTSSTGHSWPTA